MRLGCLALLVVALVVPVLAPADAATPPAAQLVAMGTGHTLQIRSDGTLWAWGYNNAGQVGVGDTTVRYVPVQVGSDTNWASVAAGGAGHSLALKNDGSLWAWGSNNSGQLGLGDTVGRYTPTRVGSATDWISIAAGQYHSLAIKADGTLWAWGYNLKGALGDNSVTSRSAPVQVGSDTDWVRATGNNFSSYGIKADGTLWAWGYNDKGQLGLGNTTDRLVPTQVGIDTNWATIAGGDSLAVGIRSDGTLWTWGWNSDGQLGLGDAVDRNVPTRVGTDTNWALVACGTRHVIATRTDGTLYAWGSNYAGNLGIGDLVNRSAPVRVGTGSAWVFPVAGANRSGALATDGKLWLWGYNLEYHLGLGLSAPTRVTAPVILNASPVAIDDTYETAYATPLAIDAPGVLANDTDADIDALSAVLEGDPAHGAIVLNADGSFTYTPNAGFSGQDTFTYRASDGLTNSGIATVTITVTSAPPVANDDTYETAYATPLAIDAPGVLANDTDADIDALSAVLEGDPAHGAIVLNADGSFTYTPNAGFSGQDTFTYRASDGFSSSGIATVTITVKVAAPVALVPVYRFYNVSSNSHFFTASEDERAIVMAKWPHIYEEEGVAYRLNAANNTQPLYRFYNATNGSHFYTASSTERDIVLARWSNVFAYEGETYKVSSWPVPNSIPVYRFYNVQNGSHFFTSSAGERDVVIARWPHVYTYEGAAFYVGQ